MGTRGILRNPTDRRHAHGTETITGTTADIHTKGTSTRHATRATRTGHTTTTDHNGRTSRRHGPTHTARTITARRRPTKHRSKRAHKHSESSRYARAQAWLRDLTEEGIESHPGPSSRVISKNINGMAGRFDTTMYKIKTDHERDPILALMIQEHHITQDCARELRVVPVAHHKHGLLFLYAARPADEGKGGTAIVIPHSSIERKKGESMGTAIERVKSSVKRRPDGRMITATTLIEGEEVLLTSIYAPVDRAQKAAFYKEIAPSIAKHSLIGMDANCVLDTTIDRRDHANHPGANEGGKELLKILADNDLTDVTRESLGDKTPFFTNHTVVSSPGPGGVPPAVITSTRIDHIHAPQIDAMTWSLRHPSVDFLKFDTTYGHDMLQVDLRVIRSERGKDLMTVNEKIYEDLAFNDQLDRDIEKLIEKLNPQDGAWGAAWEQIKILIRDRSLEQTVKIKIKKSKEAIALKAKIELGSAAIKAGLASAQDRVTLNDNIQALRQQTAKDRTLHQSIEREAYELGQKHDISTAAFHRRWTPRNSAQWIHELILRDWTDPSAPVQTAGQPDKETDPQQMAAALTKYYRPLYARKLTSRTCTRKALRALSRGKKVLDPTAAKCGAHITVEEILHTCAYVPKGKSPGPDRIPNQFYRSFSKTVAPILERVYEEGKQRGRLPTTLTEGIISILYKKKERDDPRNYRPITLLNGDYKIMMRILTQRMNQAVLQFVSRDQNGFVPDAFICENLMRLQMIQAVIEGEDSEALYLFLDMEKAFDRCSWDFLMAGLKKLNFGEEFIKFIKLAYSHDTPPTRQLYVNGYLGPRFSLGSGVAQGCPISPLLFLVIAEPLTRMINENKDIKGVVTSPKNKAPTRHKISQFADDSTLILRPRDVPAALTTIRIWCSATSMKENASKRELQLLGSLRRNPQRVPSALGVTPVADGDTIRALGVPMGNDLNVLNWWLIRYREIKRRVAMWNGLASLSITGRNILLQSILYGSMRYWFFTLTVPPEIVSIVESDAKELLWATSPELHSDEQGTSDASRRYIARMASYLPQKEGGGGITHLESHIAAFQAQWIIKYLDPRDAPWKDVLDHWILNDDMLGRGTILADNSIDHADKLPVSCTYMRACFESFNLLDMRQDTSLVTHETQGESLWHNNRFTIQLADDSIEEWTHQLDTYRLSDLLSDDGFFDYAQWNKFIQDYTPDVFTRNEAAAWTYEREHDVPIVRAGVPREVKNAIRSTPPFTDGEIVLASTPGREFYAWLRKHPNGDELDEIFLDTSRYPHATGTRTRVTHGTTLTHVALWTQMNKHYKSPYAGDEDDTPETRDSIIGPTTTAFPLNKGWYMEHQSQRKEEDEPRQLSDLTIHEITIALTKRITDGVRPNCEAKWAAKWPRPLTFKWSLIWRSLGTPLSDPTEENAWRKLLHRAINAKNRHPRNPDHACRLHCGERSESMLHMVRCRRVAPLWKACLDFCHRVLGERSDLNALGAVVFNVEGVNQGSSAKLLGEAARAFLRHAVRL